MICPLPKSIHGSQVVIVALPKLYALFSVKECFSSLVSQGPAVSATVVFRHGTTTPQLGLGCEITMVFA